MAVLLSIMHWSAAVAAQLTKVAIGYSGISADQLVIWVAKDAGIFAKNNIDAQTVVLGHHVLHKEGFSFKRNWTGDLSSSAQ